MPLQTIAASVLCNYDPAEMLCYYPQFPCAVALETGRLGFLAFWLLVVGVGQEKTPARAQRAWGTRPKGYGLPLDLLDFDLAMALLFGLDSSNSCPSVSWP